jgi:hypothetical protein
LILADVQRYGGNEVDTSKPTLKRKAYHEMKEFLIITLYLWVIFSLFNLYKSVILAEQHIPLAAHSFAFINALALAKVMLVAKALHLGDRFDNAPLIYTTLLKSALFTIVLACFKILEDAGLGLYHGKSFQQSIADLGGGTLNGILTLSLLLFVMLIPFFGFSELQRVLGEGKLVQIFLRPRGSFELPSDQSSDAATRHERS